MRKYEAIVMFYPTVEEEKRVAAFERLKKIISDNGSITNVDEWGMRKLAYEIEYNKEAFYYLVEFETEAEVIKEFDRVARILESVMRHMVVKLED
ncbi:small subunit ribosomal protein S6 [Peptoniphilus asaccharolyticus DSM 20463]|uniref:Small ribosomal subunit protein bS6 n=1 Tax=Peptoniphilus asaccharolyticus DSM 20463 TaxID=573058 RepID=A0A1W1VAI5_PEPAS|nr:30S ribosomal protein S6 [Peptoniphilus asaccharolyticus]MBL7575726.1 30S ribosomal protein S6 [Peptoniphilus asaccharolyticus]SMB90296.1 small subunit ribosomal protein S6 [Peptoniphilus asaccharolyticus DSM 20463]